MAEDQTEESWIEEYGIDAPGTGLFLKLEEGKDEFVLVFARNVTYTRAYAIADEFAYPVYKWIPQKIAAYATVKASKCASDGEPCVKTCKGLGCLCHPTRRVYVSATSGGGSSEEMQPAMSGHKEPAFA